MESHEQQPIKISNLETTASHRQFLCRPFLFKCSSVIFAESELKQLRRFGSWMEALVAGLIEPTSQTQQDFCECFCGDREPSTSFELTFQKLLHRREFEAENFNSAKYRHYDTAEAWFARSACWRSRPE